MPDRVEVFDVTCPASTLPTAPVEVVLTAPPGIPRKVTIIIPDGHAGLTGIALGFGHQPILPRVAGRYISSNDEFIPLELHGYPPGPVWSAFMCNSDLQPHSWELIFEFDEIAGSNLTAVQPEIPAQTIADTGQAQLDAQQIPETPLGDSTIATDNTDLTGP